MGYLVIVGYHAKNIYGLSPKQKDLDYTTIIGTILCLVGLFILSFNLYYDTKISTEKFTNKPILIHIPYNYNVNIW